MHRTITRWLLGKAWVRWAFMAGLIAMLAGAMAMVGRGAVKVKMLPFDNKAEFQVQLDMPAGTPRQTAFAVGQDLALRALAEPETHDVQVYAGVAAPFTFVGMVRHSVFRDAPKRVNSRLGGLLPKHARKAQSHAIVMRLRPALEAIASAQGGRLKLVEIPPGPPVLDTLVAEVYGPSPAERDRLAAQTLDAFRTTNGVVDVDSTLNPTAPKLSLQVDREKAALHGIAPARVPSPKRRPASLVRRQPLALRPARRSGPLGTGRRNAR